MFRQPGAARLTVSILLAAVCAITAPRAGAQDDWFDRLAVPLVPAEDFVSVRDASLKAVGLYPRAELMLNPWYVLGPFARDGSSSVPLRNINSAAPIKTIAGPSAWKVVPGWNDAKQSLDLAPLFKSGENVSAYLYRSIQSPGRASVEIRVSADDDFTVWLNGEEIVGRTEDGGAVAYGKHRQRAWLQQGENELVVRVGQASGAWQVFFDLEPKIDPRIEAKILAEALALHPRSPESYAGRVDLAGLFVQLGLHERALEQAHLVVSDLAAPAQPRAGADAFIRRYIDIQLETKQPWNLHTPDDLASKILPVQLTMTNRSATTATGQIGINVADVWGAPVGQFAPIPYTLAPQGALSQTVEFEPPGWGAYRVSAETKFGRIPVRQETMVSLIPNPRAGLRPESFFAVTSEEGDRNLGAIAKLGAKVTRGVFCNYRWAFDQVPPANERLPAKMDFTRLDEAVAKRKELGLSILPIVTDARPRESSVAREMKASGPAELTRDFTSVTVEIVKRLKDVKYWDFWGDPQIYGPTWAASAGRFRSDFKVWSRVARTARPDVKVLAGGRPSFLVDILETDPSAVKEMDGISNSPRHDSRALNWRSGAQLRSMDFAVREAVRKGKNLAFVIDSATERSRGQAGLTEARRTDAAKLVKLHVLAALAGNFQANISQDRGWGVGFPVGNVAYAVEAHLLEDRPIAADIWPAHPLIWGAIFAHPRWITDAVKALPRADTLAARWGVPIPNERENDATKVAVIWSQTGPDAKHLDENGTLTITPAGDLRALDMVGRPVGQKHNDALTVPFGQYPVYLLSDQLGVVEMRKRIAEGRIENVTPVNSYLFSLPQPLGDRPTTLTARVQNQLNRRVKGTIALAGPKPWTIKPAQRPFELAPAELAEIDFQVTATTNSVLNQYVVRTAIDSDAGTCERREIVSVACVVPMSPSVDGNIADWKEAVFTRMDVQQLNEPERYMEWLADPTQPRPELSVGQAFVGVKLAAAYDENNVYFAVVVREPGLGNNTDGRPESYDENPMLNGDCLELAFGFDERSKDDYHGRDDPWHWKGVFRDVDYSIIQTRQRADQPVLLSLYVPGLMWRTDFQTERMNTFDLVRTRRAQSRFVRDEGPQTTTYEIAVPRRYLRRFDPSSLYLRMSFVYFNDEKVPPLEWAQACGVFDYWSNFGSFLPAWMPFLPCQTRWGIVQ